MDPVITRELITRCACNNMTVKELEFIRKDPEGVTIEPISDHGMVNYIFKVKSQTDHQSVIIKHGTDTMRLDPSEKVNMMRQDAEFYALKLLTSIYADCAPKAFCLDKELNIIVMEDLSSMGLLGSQLSLGSINLQVATNLGKLLGKVHMSTSQEVVSNEQWETWSKIFRKQDDLEYYIDYMLTRIFDEDSPINKIAESVLPIFRKCVRRIHEKMIPNKLRELFGQDRCFIHGDCHMMAIFTKGENVKVFDLEFAFLSHPAQNVAMAITSYPLCNQEASLRSGVNADANLENSKHAVRNMANAYFDEVSNIELETFLPELAIFCGAAIFFFTNFFCVDEFVRLTDEQKIYLLQVATDLMVLHTQITNIEQLVDYMFPDKHDYQV